MSDSTVISAFTEHQVERLTSLTASQLRYWDKTGFFAPSYAGEHRGAAYNRIYSFRDVVALRTLSVLRRQNNVPLQHLRKVAERLAGMTDSVWTGITFYVLNRKVIIDVPGTDKKEEAVTRQYVIGIPMQAIITETHRDVASLRHRSDDKIGKIERSRLINHNAYVIAGTRIPVAAIKRFEEDGYSVEQILKEYPTLCEADVNAALKHVDDKAA